MAGSSSAPPAGWDDMARVSRLPETCCVRSRESARDESDAMGCTGLMDSGTGKEWLGLLIGDLMTAKLSSGAQRMRLTWLLYCSLSTPVQY